MALPINQQGISFLSVNGQTVPPEGAKALPLTLDFSLTTQYTLNLQNIVSRNFISMIQSLYLDNSNNTAPLTVNFSGTNQSITIAPGRQAYKTVLCQNPPSMSFSSTGGVVVNIQLLNFPVSNSDWPTYTGA